MSTWPNHNIWDPWESAWRKLSHMIWSLKSQTIPSNENVMSVDFKLCKKPEEEMWLLNKAYKLGWNYDDKPSLTMGEGKLVGSGLETFRFEGSMPKLFETQS